MIGPIQNLKDGTVVSGATTLINYRAWNNICTIGKKTHVCGTSTNFSKVARIALLFLCSTCTIIKTGFVSFLCVRDKKFASGGILRCKRHPLISQPYNLSGIRQMHRSLRITVETFERTVFTAPPHRFMKWNGIA